jgi:hypothetical protein
MADHSGTTLTNYTLTNYDIPVYSKNTTFSTGYFTKADLTAETNPDAYTTQRAGTEDDWNAKLIWHTGDEGPTLYLDGFKYDLFNEESGKWRKASATATKAMEDTAITPDTNYPFTIVLQGEDSVIKTKFGIPFAKDITIKSEGDTKKKCCSVKERPHASCRTKRATDHRSIQMNRIFTRQNHQYNT